MARNAHSYYTTQTSKCWPTHEELEDFYGGPLAATGGRTTDMATLLRSARTLGYSHQTPAATKHKEWHPPPEPHGWRNREYVWAHPDDRESHKRACFSLYRQLLQLQPAGPLYLQSKVLRAPPWRAPARYWRLGMLDALPPGKRRMDAMRRRDISHPLFWAHAQSVQDVIELAWNLLVRAGAVEVGEEL